MDIKTASAVPPEVLRQVLGMSVLGAGSGMGAGLLRGKDLGESLTDVAHGASSAGMSGGIAGLGAALLASSLGKNVNPLLWALHGAGAGAGIGALFSGFKDKKSKEEPAASAPPKDDNRLSTEELVRMALEQHKISSVLDTPGDIRDSVQHSQFRDSQQQTNGDQFGGSPSTHTQNPSSAYAPQNTRQDALVNALTQHTVARQRMQNAILRNQRADSAAQLFAPVGEYLGGHAGRLVSRIAGTRKREGIPGWFGMTENVIDPDRSEEVGRVFGRAGVGALASQLAGMATENPDISHALSGLNL